MTPPESDPMHELLGELRALAEPSATDKARVLSVLPIQVAVPTAAASSVWGPWTLVGGVVFGLVTGAIGYSLGWSQALRKPPALSFAEKANIPKPPLQPEASARPQPETVVSEPVFAPDSQKSRRPSLKRKAPARTRGTSVQPPARPFGFRETLERLQLAELEIRAGRGLAALTLLNEIDTHAPKDVLSEERLVSRVLAFCDVGDHRAAKRSQRMLKQFHPLSMYRGRISESCVGLSKSEIFEH